MPVLKVSISLSRKEQGFIKSAFPKKWVIGKAKGVSGLNDALPDLNYSLHLIDGIFISSRAHSLRAKAQYA